MILKELKIQTWIGDPTNCYIIFDEKSKETMVIDPAGDVDKIQEMINILGGKLKISSSSFNFPPKINVYFTILMTLI